MRNGFIALLLVLLLFVACQTVPITGRQQLHLIPSDTVLSMSFDAYKDFMKDHKKKVIVGTEDAQMVKRAGQRIQGAVERYLSANNLSRRLKGYQWEFNLIDDKEINAWAMPGGKVVVYTGILPVAQNENGLAVVMGHEIAHAIAQHGDERMSQALLAEMGGIALSVAVSEKSQETQALFLAAYGVGAGLGVLLPYSRLHESEADKLGLIFMAMAGYDPRSAPDFWRRMATAKKGGSPPEFLSTHPSDEKRIRNLEKAMPEALQYYKT